VLSSKTSSSAVLASACPVVALSLGATDRVPESESPDAECPSSASCPRSALRAVGRIGDAERYPRELIRADEPSDEQLIVLYRSGDTIGWELLFRRYRAQVLALATRRLRDPSEAEDIMQESFARLGTMALSNWPPRRPRPVLLQIADNLCTDRHRTSRRHPVESLEHCPDAEYQLTVDPETRYLVKEVGRRISAMLAELKPMHREVFEMRALERLSYREIAERLGITRRAAESHYSRAVQRLRAMAPDDTYASGLRFVRPLSART
jgi:RNA polymerase sigma-70 factor (ECF subfamily)